ncbi:MAG TPA: YCF48-related protein [Thermoanaerobaculia bacterium]|nr:YCF48-related protein [Thermoanaerobaculia bacterium]
MTRHQLAARGAALLAALFLALAAAAPAADGGERSTLAPLAVHSLLLDAADRDGLAIAVGERGHVLVSRDGGATWEQVAVPTRAMLTGVSLREGGLAWAVGHDETILRSRDGGATWELVHSAPEEERPLLDVWFADAETGFAVGAYGLLLVTRDGGTTWEPGVVAEDSDFHLNQIAASGDSLYLAAEAGHLYRSDDEGGTWTPLPSPYDGSFFGVLPLGDGALLAHGLRGNLFRSEDKGASWSEIPTGSEATLTAGRELPEGRVVIAGLAGALLWSDDGGRTFRGHELPDRKATMALLPAGDGSLVLLGEGGVRRAELPR